MNKQEQLTSLGYREMEPNIWGKPVGFHLFIYEVDKKKWANHFVGNNKKLLIWETITFTQGEEDELVENIGVVEQYTKIHMGNWEYPLNFTTQIEQINNFLEN